MKKQNRRVGKMVAHMRHVLALASFATSGIALAEQPQQSMSSMSVYPYPIDPGHHWRANAAFGGGTFAPPPPPIPRTNPVSPSSQSAAASSMPRTTYTPPPSSASTGGGSVNQAAFSSGQQSTGGSQAESGSGRSGGQSQRITTPGSSGGTGKKNSGTSSIGTATQAPVYSGKSGKEPVALAPETSLINFGATAGYYSHYLFRGLDVGYRTGIDKANDSDFFGASTSLSIGNFGLGFWYMHSLDSYVPGGAGFDNSFGRISGPRNNRIYANDLDFRTPARERYQEYDIFTSYTFNITDDLSITPGMNFYFFSDGRFWANGKDHVDSTVEAAVSLTYTGIKGLVQNLNYYYDFDAFKGGYLEYRLSTTPIKLFENNFMAVGIVPSVGVSYDFKYNGSNNGWNNIEPGIDIPIQLADGLTLNLGARYALDLGDSSVGAGGRAVDRTDDRLYFSAALQFNWGGTGAGGVLDGQGDKGSLADVATFVEPPGPWSITAGVSTRSIDADFDVSAAKPYNMSSLFRRLRGGGDRHLATSARDAHYLDGSVYSASGTAVAFQDGTSTFSFNSPSQLSDAGTAYNRQLSFRSQHFSYSQTSDFEGFSSSDDDQPIQPYLNFSREIKRWDKLSLSFGLGYSFGRSSFDSGTGLVGLQTVRQTQEDHLFTYDVDEIFSMDDTIPPGNYNVLNDDPNSPNYAWVIFDGGTYSNTYSFSDSYTIVNPNDFSFNRTVPNASSQHAVREATQEIARVAVFRGSSVDVDSHSISAPIDLALNLTPRIAAKLSFGPTLNIFNVDMKTDTYYQLLEPQGGVRVKGGLSSRPNAAPVLVITDTTGIDPNFSGTFSAREIGSARGGSGKPTLSTAASGNRSTSSGATISSAGAPAGGKGSADGRSRILPGKTLAHVINRYSGQEIEWGVFGQLGIQADLDAQKRWFMEAFVRYDYVPEFTVSDGASSVSIDASSWGAGVGVGFRF